MKRFTLKTLFVALLVGFSTTAMADTTIKTNDLTIKPGETAELSFALTNPGETTFTAFQFDIMLPKGFSFVYDAENDDYFVTSTARLPKNYSLLYKLQTNGAMRFLGYSAKLALIKGESGDICSITVKADASVKSGVYTDSIFNIEVSRTNVTAVRPAASLAKITVPTTDGIVSATAAPANDNCYDLQGRRVANPAKGVYIVGGKKVIK